jgi:hypothetical protein
VNRKSKVQDKRLEMERGILKTAMASFPKATKNSEHSKSICDNWITQNFDVEQPNQA